MRFINAYGRQETDNEELRNAFFSRIDLEVKSSLIAGSLVCLELDANAKIGTEEITNDPNNQSPNGKLLMKIVNENGLIVVNSSDICEGLITRKRKVLNTTEESILDYFIVCSRFFRCIKKMKIDEDRIYSLGSFSKSKGGSKFTESDHNMLFLELDCSLNTAVKNEEQRE